MEENKELPKEEVAIEVPEKQEISGDIPRNEDGTFPKGISGNPKGRPRRKTLTELIHAKLDETNGWDAIVAKVIELSVAGNRHVLKQLWDHTDGMPKQKVEHTGEDGEPIKHVIVLPSNGRERLPVIEETQNDSPDRTTGGISDSVPEQSS